MAREENPAKRHKQQQQQQERPVSRTTKATPAAVALTASYRSNIRNNEDSIVRGLRYRRLNGRLNHIYTVQSKLDEQSIANIVLQKSIRGHANSINCLLFDRTEKYIFTAGNEKFIKAWELTTAKLLYTFRGHEDLITCLAVNQENSLLASGSFDKTVRVWNLSSGSCVCCLYGSQSLITSIKFHPSDGTSVSRYIIAGTQEGHILSWPYRDHNTAWIFQSTKQPFVYASQKCDTFTCASFSTSGTFLAVVLDDCYTLTIFALYSDLISIVFQLPPSISNQVIIDLQFSNRDSRFVSVAERSLATLWAPGKGGSADARWTKKSLKKPYQVFGCKDPRRQYGSNIKWSIDDKYIIIIGNSCRIGVWNSYTCELIQLINTKYTISIIETNPKHPAIIMTVDSTSTIQIFNIETGQLLAMHNPGDERYMKPTVFSCKFSPKGQMFASADKKGFLHIHGVGKNKLYDAIPTEMFFNSDYHAVSCLKHYNGTFVLDAFESVTPSLMPKPILVDMSLYPYEEKYQKLVNERNKPIVKPLNELLKKASYAHQKDLIELEKVYIRDHFGSDEIEAIDDLEKKKLEYLKDGEVITLTNCETDNIVDIETI